MGDPKVIHTSKEFLVLEKPAGLLMHPFRVGTAKGKIVVKEPTLTDWLIAHYPETKTVGDNPEMRPGIVHRLDRETSGVLIVARTQNAFEYFKEQFQTKKIQKKYLALVNGELENEEGIIDKPISLKPGTIKRTVHGGKMTKEAVTEYKVKERFVFDGNHYTLLEVFPLTGRTHQIRVHLSSIGHPIIGDTIYSKKKRKEEKALLAHRLMLHAFSISFQSPSGKLLHIEGHIPDDFEAVLKVVRGE